ncbi:MAG: DHH family phosphoesterase [Janthinobacterium lividum]
MDAEIAGRMFVEFLAPLPQGKATDIHILTDADADGLPAGALLYRALQAAGYASVTVETRGKFENAWMPAVHERLRLSAPECLIVADLGTRPDTLLVGVPTLLIDHHAPFGTPPGATLMTSYGTEPTATTGLLALWCAQAIAPAVANDLQWMAGISLLSDLGDKAPFPDLAESKKRFGVTALKDLTSLLNAPRRTAAGDATPAMRLLLTATSPKQALATPSPELDALRFAKTEVSEALAVARKAPPRFATRWREELGADMIAVRIDTPCQVHPLVAQIWRPRFPKAVVFGVNVGFRPGFVHFAGRAPKNVNLVQFLRAHTPAGADGTFGGGHDQASGGALPVALWNPFAMEMGWGPELQVAEASEQSELFGLRQPRIPAVVASPVR